MIKAKADEIRELLRQRLGKAAREKAVRRGGVNDAHAATVVLRPHDGIQLRHSAASAHENDVGLFHRRFEADPGVRSTVRCLSDIVFPFMDERGTSADDTVGLSDSFVLDMWSGSPTSVRHLVVNYPRAVERFRAQDARSSVLQQQLQSGIASQGGPGRGVELGRHTRPALGPVARGRAAPRQESQESAEAEPLGA